MSDMFYGIIYHHPSPSRDFNAMRRSLCAGREDVFSSGILDIRMRTWFKRRYKTLIVKVRL